LKATNELNDRKERKPMIDKLRREGVRQLSKPKCKYPREYTDSELHEMLQDLLDAGGEKAWMAEMNIRAFHWQLSREPEEQRATLRLVK
jgi:hypothetical protein